MTTGLFRDLPINRKLTIVSMLTCIFALLVACTAFLAYESTVFRTGTVDATTITARMIADNSAAALTFEDPSSAEMTLKSLASDPNIMAGVVYDKGGKVFADYRRAGLDNLHLPPAQPEGHHFEKDQLDLYCKISLDGEFAGTVFIQSDLAAMKARLWKYVLIIGIVFSVSSCVAFLLSKTLQTSISRPVSSLASVVSAVAAMKDYSLRVPKGGKDEMGMLIDGFNEMLGEIQSRDSALEAAREDLEKRVEERTRDLANSLALLNSTLDATVDGILAVRFSGEMICHNSKFLEMWEVPEELAAKKDGMIIAEFAAKAVKNPEEFLGQIKLLFDSPRPEAFDTLELNNGDIFERTVKPHLIAGKCVGMVVSFRDVTERKRAEAELEKAHKELVEISRQAGMAEVATSVLHNVGNVLNSVNISCATIFERVRKSRIVSVAKVSALLRENETNLADFFETNPAGQKLPEFLEKLASRLNAEQAEVLAELESLGKNIDHIKDIVAVQQSYAKNVGGVREILSVTGLVEDALRMNAEALTRHQVSIVREFSETPPAALEKHKVLQILVNLFRNAKHALTDSGRDDKRLVIRIGRQDDNVAISVSDNGVGIAPENMTRIFAHGFTTKKKGHGFGLHSGVLAAQEMGGRLSVKSNGPGTGATFTLELPIASKASALVNV